MNFPIVLNIVFFVPPLIIIPFFPFQVAHLPIRYATISLNCKYRVFSFTPFCFDIVGLVLLKTKGVVSVVLKCSLSDSLNSGLGY